MDMGAKEKIIDRWNRIPTEARMLVLLLFCLGLFGALARLNIPLPRTESAGETDVPILLPTSSQEISRIDLPEKTLVFSFDAGSGDISAAKILDVLGKHKVKGTFFMTGKFAEEHPDLVRDIVRRGHEIFNHTYSHPRMTELSSEEIGAELEKMDAILRNIAKISARPYFRPPFGDRDDRVLESAYANGYQSVYWSVDAGDWEIGATNESVKNKIYGNALPGTIFLMHVGDAVTGDILDEVFTKFEREGYRLLSLGQAVTEQNRFVNNK